MYSYYYCSNTWFLFKVSEVLAEIFIACIVRNDHYRRKKILSKVPWYITVSILYSASFFMNGIFGPLRVSAYENAQRKRDVGKEFVTILKGYIGIE